MPRLDLCGTNVPSKLMAGLSFLTACEPYGLYTPLNFSLTFNGSGYKGSGKPHPGTVQTWGDLTLEVKYTGVSGGSLSATATLSIAGCDEAGSVLELSSPGPSCSNPGIGFIGSIAAACCGLPSPPNGIMGGAFASVPRAIAIIIIGCPFCCDNGSCDNPPKVSAMPVNYATGELYLVANDLVSLGYAVPWGHTRTYASRLSVSETLGQGYNWQVTQWPYLVLDGGSTIAAQGQPNSALWFDQVGDSYVGRFGILDVLTHDSVHELYRITAIDGTYTEYDDFSGMFVRQVDLAGNKIEVTSWNPNGFNVNEVQRTITIDGVTTVEKYAYSYDGSSGDQLLESVALSRQRGESSPVNVSRAVYTYYPYGSEFGAQEDLETATTQVWQDGSWQNTGTSYYRYYTDSGSSSSSSSSGGSNSMGPYQLKYVLNSASYDRMVDAEYDPLTASDAELSMFADYYFEYDDQRRVTKETVMSGSQTYTFSYTESGFDDGLNAWRTKTVETQPDGTQNIVYSNYANQPMLKVLKSGANQWIEFWAYDQNHQPILHALPSAVSGYDDTYADLLNFDPDTSSYEYLRDDSGQIKVLTFHAPSGQLASESVQEGQLETPILLRTVEYCACGSDCSCSKSSSSSSSNSSSSSILRSGDSQSGPWFLAKQTLFPSDTDPSQTIETNHCYSFYPGSCAVQQHITTLPVIATHQNGSGVANSNREYFDIVGRLTWKMDERGFITRMSYDVPTGAMTQLVQDADTSLYPDAPPGWTTPSGGGSNLVTDSECDEQGRITQTLGPVHSIDLNGTATMARTASWRVYDDANHITYSGQGYATGTSPGYTYTLVNPVSITKKEADGRVTEQIQAVAPNTSGSLSSIIDTAGGGASAFPQSSYTRWTTNQYTDCCLLASQRVYHTIPATGEGTVGANYDESDFGYDIMKRRNRIVTPGGTITDIVFDPRGLVIGTYVGTNDDGATENDPTGGGSGGSDPDNNMVIVTGNEYDDGLDGGDGNLTEVTQHVDATTTRVTSMTYDFRDRNVTTDGEVDYFQKLYYDNLSRVIRTERYNTTSAGNLIARSEARYDSLGRIYQSIVYGVDPSTGTVGNSLVDNTWFDASSNVVKSLPSGSDLFVKTTYDSLGRPTVQYQGYDLDESSYAEAFTVTDDVIMAQTETAYDAASNAIQSTSRQRYHNAPDTQKGALQTPTTTPKARVIYAAAYNDGVGRPIASANYGTNGGTSLSRPSTIPVRSDDCLVSTTSYDFAGNVLDLTDPAGIVTRTEYDDAGRRVTTIENFQSGSSSSSSSSSNFSGNGCQQSDDANRTTLYSYTPDGQQATMTAVNPDTTNQTTTWTYGTTLTESGIATSLFLRSVIYPDSASGSDVVSYTCNRLSQRTSLTDQRGCVHQYDYDKLGRPIHDRVTTTGTDVDDAVLRISGEYEVRGMLEKLTSWNNPSVTSGDAVNEVQWKYNDFGQSTQAFQAHDGQVNTMSTASVRMGYADGSANTIRPTTLTYPNGRVVTNSYGTSGSITDATSQIASLVDSDVGSTHLADYSYLGLGAVVQQDSLEADLRYTLISLAGMNDPDTGDIYAGLDRFGRVKDCRWRNASSNTDLSRVLYGYNRDSSRIWRANPTDPDQHFDWLYGYDGLQRLKSGDRGTLNGTKTGIADLQFGQCWTLDATGNWKSFRQNDDGSGTWDLVQARVASTVNEITAISNSVGSAWVYPAYDPVGNMTTMPQPADPTSGFDVTYDAWNRLSSLSDSSSHDVIQLSAYDGRGFCVIRIAPPSSTTRHLYYTDAWRNIEDRLGSTPENVAADQQFVWGVSYIDHLICRDRSTNSTLDERLYACQDATWNVTAVIAVTGDVEERFEYDPYGMLSVLSPSFDARDGSSFTWEVTFSGHRSDTVSRLMLARTRIYTPLVGFWTRRDPMGNWDGPSLYTAYFIPNRNDPFGLQTADDYREAYGQFPPESEEEEEQEEYTILKFMYFQRLSGVNPISGGAFNVRLPERPWGRPNIPGALMKQRPLTDDEKRVVKLCDGDLDCLLILAHLMTDVWDTPLPHKHHAVGNKCFDWLNKFLTQYPKWTPGNSLDIGGGITLTPEELVTKNDKLIVTVSGPFGLPPSRLGGRGFSGHGVVKVTFAKSGGVAYFDIGDNTDMGSFGGSDHWFFLDTTPECAELMDLDRTVPYRPTP